LNSELNHTVLKGWSRWRWIIVWVGLDTYKDKQSEIPTLYTQIHYWGTSFAGWNGFSTFLTNIYIFNNIIDFHFTEIV